MGKPTHSRRLLIVAALTAAALVVSGCDGIGVFGNLGVNQNLPVFDVERFEDNILDTFTGQSVGFTYAIAVQGDLKRSGAVGEGRINPDGNRDMSVGDRMHVASVSKTITTIAVLRLLEDENIDIDSPFDAFLPPAWGTPGPGVSGLTFEDLLLHQTGFSFPANQSRFYEDDLAAMIRTGVVNDSGGQVYSNAHHNLLKVLAARILNPGKLLGETDENYHARVFGEYVEEVIFDPLSISWDVTPPADPNLYYSFPSGGFAGQGTSSSWIFTTDFGAYGYYVSSVGLVAILSYLFNSELLVSEEASDEMAQNEYGFWNSRTGDKGRYLMKQGGWGINEDGVNKGVQSIVAHYPDGVDAAVVVNSRPSPAFNMANVMRDAYDNAFVDP